MNLISKILAPIDCSEASINALNYAIKIAKKHRAELTVLYVVSYLKGTGSQAFSKDKGPNLTIKKGAKNQLEESWKSLGENEIEADLVVEYGDPFTEIMRCAKSKKNDVVVMGSHGRTGLMHVVMGSVAEKVVRYSPIPVLVVKDESHDLFQKFDYEYDLHKQY